jgi:tripartite-type tricarboxylate transporter receptor subunit TctC
MKRLPFITGVIATCVALAAPLLRAQDAYPSRPIRWIVPFPPGGTNDVLARTIGQKLAVALRQPVVVENRAGASGAIGTVEALKAPADGHTLVIGSSLTHAANPALYPKLGYDPVLDSQAVTLLVRATHVLVVPGNSPYRTVRDLVQAKAPLAFGSSSPGSAAQIVSEIFRAQTGINANHVPYKGSAQHVNDLLGGHMPFSFVTLGSVKSYLDGGQLRALAVDAHARLPQLPNVPTLREAGYPQEPVPAWQGVFVRAGTPAPVVERLYREIRQIAASPDVRATLENAGFELASMTPTELQDYVRREVLRWGDIIRKARITVD